MNVFYHKKIHLSYPKTTEYVRSATALLLHSLFVYTTASCKPKIHHSFSPSVLSTLALGIPVAPCWQKSIDASANICHLIKKRIHHWLHGEIYLLNTTTPQADEQNLGSQEISALDYSCTERPLLLCKQFLGCHPRIFFPRKKDQDTLYHFSNPNRQLLTEQRTTSTTYEKLMLHITVKSISTFGLRIHLPFFEYSKLTSYPLKVFLIIVLDPYICSHAVGFQHSI